jgi:hypothetical protein
MGLASLVLETMRQRELRFLSRIRPLHSAWGDKDALAGCVVGLEPRNPYASYVTGIS